MHKDGDESEIDETHALFLPDSTLVMPTGDLPVVRAGTVGGIPAYEADAPKTIPVMPDVVAVFHSEAETHAETAARMKTPAFAQVRAANKTKQALKMPTKKASAKRKK